MIFILNKGVHEKEANIMDPMSRIIMEKAVEAILDAGFHPFEFEGTRTGVFVTTLNSDSQPLLYRHDLEHQNYVLTGYVIIYNLDQAKIKYVKCE